MSYQQEREQFIARVTAEGLPYRLARMLLREATGFNRRAELACSSEWADKDRVPCPAIKGGPCLCDRPMGEFVNGAHSDPHAHEPVTRIAVQDMRAERRIEAALPAPWVMLTQGDPRGYCLRVIPPGYAERNTGRDRFNLDSIGVPSGPSGLRF